VVYAGKGRRQPQNVKITDTINVSSGRPRKRRNKNKSNGLQHLKNGMNMSKSDKVEMCLGKYVRSLQDPWKWSSCIPDGARNVLTCTAKLASTITTDANGQAALCFAPVPYASNIVSGSTGGATAAYAFSGNFNTITSYSSLTALSQRFRPVSMGIKCGYMGGTMNDQGSLFLGISPPGYSASYYNVAFSSLAANTNKYSYGPVHKGGILRWFPQDEIDVREFVPMVSGSTCPYTTGIPAGNLLIVAVTGAQASSAVLSVDFVYNFEIALQTSNLVYGDGGDLSAAAAPGFLEKALNAVEDIPETIIGGIETVGSDVASGAKTVAQDIIGAPGDVLDLLEDIL
jgi:hypothetical protein